MLEYAAEMERRRCRVPFECISRPERIDEAVADALASLGCSRLWLGSESGSQRVLDAMDRRITLDQVHTATRLLQARRIEVGMFIMLGYEGEEFGDLAETVAQLKQLRPDVFLTTVAYPIKGTPYYTQVEDRIRTDRPWAERTDRDVHIRGRHTRRYYQFARRWINHEVERSHRWQQGRYLSAAYAAASASVARVALSVTSRRRDA